jgi:hypothetical protein
MAQKLCIPNLGTIMVLAEDWTFKLYFESRNSTLLNVFGAKKKYWYRRESLKPEDFEDGEVPDCIEYEPAMSEEELESAYKSYKATNKTDNPFIRVTLLKGTQLKVDRIYIRQGGESFASVTFRTTKVGPEKKYAGKRFWVKLRDANEIVADIIG